MTYCEFRERIREDGHALEHGELAPEPATELRAHVARCASCREELRLQNAVGEWMRNHTPDAAVSDAVWERIERKIAVPSKRLVLARWAAVVMLGLMGIWLWRTSSSMPADAIIAHVQANGSDELQPVRPGEIVTIQRFSTIDMPGIGSLRAREATRLMFTGPRTMDLKSGEIFAQVTPGSLGFTVTAGPHSVEVIGTRYGMRWSPEGEGLATVYVVEGTVRCSSPEGTRLVREDEIVVLKTPAAPERVSHSGLGAYLEWVRPHEPAGLAMAIDKVRQQTDTVEFSITIRSPSVLPVYVPAPDHVRSYMFFTVKDPEGKEFAVRLDRETIRETSMPHLRDGVLRLDPGEAWTLQGRFPSNVFARMGTYTLTAQLHVKKDGLSGVWYGTLDSPPATFVMK